MIKTFNINLAGQIFNINEDAYDQLLSYFTSLENFYTNEEGKEEILNDIKSRFAEIFLANGKDYIINSEDAVKAINNMGKPEEIEMEENTQPSEEEYTTEKSSSSKTAFSTGKRLYRNPDNALVAGVCSGLSAYFGISDPIWIRIAAIITVFIGFGSPFLIYLILWIIMPEAHTSTQKLEMKGEQINLSNIEKKVKNEFNAVSENMNKNGHGVLSQIVAFLGGAVKLFFKFLLGLGIFVLALVGGSLALAFFITLIVFSVMAILGIPLLNNFFFVNNSDGWLLGLGGLLVASIPIIFGIVALVHVLSKKTKPLKKQVVYPLVGLFLFGILLLNISGYHAKQLMAEKKRINQTFPLNYAYKSDTLQLTMNPALKDEEYDNISINGVTDLMDFITDHDEKFFPIEIEIYPSMTDSFTVVKEYSAKGKNEQDAISNATSFKHSISQINNKLILDPYIQFEGTKVKFRNQKIKIKVYVPEGKVIRWDKRTERYMDVDKLAINWDNVVNSGPLVPPMPLMPPHVKKGIQIKMKNKSNSDTSKIIINIDSDNEDINDALQEAQDKLDEARERLQEANISIEDSLEIEFENKIHRQHYIFKMVNGELIAID